MNKGTVVWDEVVMPIEEIFLRDGRFIIRSLCPIRTRTRLEGTAVVFDSKGNLVFTVFDHPGFEVPDSDEKTFVHVETPLVIDESVPETARS